MHGILYERERTYIVIAWYVTMGLCELRRVAEGACPAEAKSLSWQAESDKLGL